MRPRVRARRALLPVLILLVGVTTVGASETCERVQYLMGTTARVRVWAPDRATCETAVDSAFAAFERVDSAMSTYRDDSLLSELNRDGGTRWVAVGPDLVEVLAAAKRFHRLSDGAFDPTVLPLMRLWGFRGGGPGVPSDAEVERVLDRTGMALVELDRDRARVRFRREGVAIDLGGIAKGFALDLAKRKATAAGADSGLLDLGGNLLVFGEAASGPVGIQHPADRERIAGRVVLRDQSVATSGGYERFVEIDGKRYAHIIDPRTGYPADRVAGVTVVSETGMTADALSTACAVLGKGACLEMVGRVAGSEAAVLSLDGDSVRIQTTPGFGLLDD